MSVKQKDPTCDFDHRSDFCRQYRFWKGSRALRRQTSEIGKGKGASHRSTVSPKLLVKCEALPLIPFRNNCQGCGDFEPVTGLVDAYNLLLSGDMDDIQSVANAFLALYGMQGTTQEDINDANRTRILSLAEGGRAEFVVKNLNHEALAQLEVNLRRSILQLSMTPDLSDEGFAGNASGVALQYKLWGIEQVRAAKERSFSAAVQDLLRVLSAGYALLGTPVDCTAANITFYKNLPENHGEQIEQLLSLSEYLSRRTILENLPWVKDADTEMEQKAREG